MKISDLFKRDTDIKSLKQDAVENKKTSSRDRTDEARPGDDTISISPRARQYRQVADILGDDEAARAKKVANLKARVADGSYNVSNAEVAKSIVSYVGGKDE